jgi:hypothetical protein
VSPPPADERGPQLERAVQRRPAPALGREMRRAVGLGMLLVREGEPMTETPPEPPDIGPEGPVHEDDPPTEPDGGPERRTPPEWA